MSSHAGAEDGLAVLQLRKWSRFPFKLSEFREAFISPTREQLLLLSYQCEALLLSLTADRCYSEDLRKPRSLLLRSSEQTASCQSDSTDNATCSTGLFEITSDNVFPHGSGSCDQYPVICDVKSLAWGHCGDAYSQQGGFPFREILVVAGDHGITVHAFCSLVKNNESINSSSENGVVHGTWVEWGPNHNKQAENMYSSHSSSCEKFCDTDGIAGAERNQHVHDGVGGAGSDGSFTSKKWFTTFHTEVETSEAEGDFIARFPEKSSFPHATEVVSFNIYESTLKFLESHSNTFEKKQNIENVSGSMDFTSICRDPGSINLSISSESPSKISIPEACTHCEASGLVNPYECPRVFSSSSHHYVGLVLKYTDDAPIDANNEKKRNTNRTFVIIVSIYQWGLRWVYSVDLQGSFPGQVLFSEWADFQFSDNFLVCLNTSGLICIWDAKSGKAVMHLDVVQSCGLDLEVHPHLDQSEHPLKGDFSSMMERFTAKDEQNNELHGRETHTESYVSRRRIFKRLVVASYSLLLAAIDEHGIIYVICADDYVSENHAYSSFVSPVQNSGFGVLAGWKVAASEIGCQKDISNLSRGPTFEFLPNSYGSFSSTDNTAEIECRKKKRRHIIFKGNRLDSYSSAFLAASRIENCQTPLCGISKASIRKVFLPIYKFNTEDPICFSPFGITRLRRCNTKEQTKIVHTCLRVVSSFYDERDLNKGLHSRWFSSFNKESALVGETIGCCFQGCFYLVMQDGLSVVLPSLSVSSGVLPVESNRYWRPSNFTGNQYQREILSVKNEQNNLWTPWQVEVLDRTLLHEGPEDADNICLENGWDLKIARVRQMELALYYLKYNEIERSLEMLVDVNLAEEGILRLLFTSVYHLFCKVGSENEVALAARLLTIAACFAIKMVRRYGLLEHEKDSYMFSVGKGMETSSQQPHPPNTEVIEISNSRRLQEMAHFIEIIRNLQLRLSVKCRKPGQGVVDSREASTLVDTNTSQEESPFPILSLDSVPSRVLDASEIQHLGGKTLPAPDLATDRSDIFDLLPLGNMEMSEFVYLASAGVQERKTISLENPKDMITRWEIDKLDLKTVVKDALHSGRLPLAVLQLHIQRLRELVTEEEPHDSFGEVRDAGRSIAYDLLLKGESGLAIATLQRLGEDLETSLRQLAFGTVRKSIRIKIAEEMKRFGHMKSHEWMTLERLSLIERLYPSSSFWRAYFGRQKKISEDSLNSVSPEENRLLIYLHLWGNFSIECGEIDGVVIGSWTKISKDFTCSVVDEDTIYAGYWACAAVWSDSWDQRTIDRIVLDQPLIMGIHVPWESQLEYHMAHNDWEEIQQLLDMIPTSILSDGTLKIYLDSAHPVADAGCNEKLFDTATYVYSEELEPVCINIPNVKIFKLSASDMCSSWLKKLMEQKLARNYIFLTESWEGTAEIMPLLAHAGLIIDIAKSPIEDESPTTSPDFHLSNISENFNQAAAEAFHKLVIRYCAQYNLPNFLDLYLDHHKLVLDDYSLCSLKEAAGGCQWAKWLLFSRVKGCEYDASFSNARSILSHHMALGSKLSILEVDEIIHTVDDMAEGGGEMAALATLMYAPIPIQKCLCSGSVNRHSSFSSQCTLENLRPALQHFPTLRRTFVAACFGHDADGCSLSSSSNNVFGIGKSALYNYLDWRDKIFSSSGGDTSLIQMLPCWFPKSVRRLVKHFVQGPLGWQTLSGSSSTGESLLQRENAFIVNANGDNTFSGISWEAGMQKCIEEELYSSLEENKFGVEHHLHRGRALEAFNHLLGFRALKYKSAHAHQELSGGSAPGQTNIQSDVQRLLGPLTQNEGPLISAVMPLAIMHFEDSMLVASCAFLLELCGLSASMLRVDVAALQRISSYYKSKKNDACFEHVAPKGSALHAVTREGNFTISLAQALADAYLRHENHNIFEQKDASLHVEASKQPPRSLITVLHHLEKASLPLMDDDKTCGSWLLTGSGNGTEYRSQQKAASQHWNLITAFCQMHHLPLSTKYLAVLAKDNDWVGFLTEAQAGGFPIDTVIQVASQEFSDPRLKIHILTVLKSMQSTRKKTSSTNPASTIKVSEMSLSESNTLTTVELFGLVAECERQKNPGEALLTKAKDLRWSLLAMIASCFSDVSPLSCLTVWLEITAARETSSIKVNDISSKIANNVGAAVEATNALPTSTRACTFRYNRRNLKRRRQMEPTSPNGIDGSSINVPDSSISAKATVAQGITSEKERMKVADEQAKISSNPDEGLLSLSNMVAVLCEQHLFLPLLRAFEMFLPSCSLLPFIRALQAISQMRLSEASAHLASFSTRIKEEPYHMNVNTMRDGHLRTTWISSTAVKAADAMLSTCPSAYERRCLLQLLAAADFGDGGTAATCFRRQYWKINLAEPSLRKDDDLYLGNETLDDASLLMTLENSGHWEQARNWAKQLESSGAPSQPSVHHVTEMQAEAMVAEWKEFLWDIPEERAALWGHCQTLFLRYSLPALQAGKFFLKHAESFEKDVSARELHEMLLLSLQWLSGTITQSNPVYSLHLVREIETRVWLLAVESEAQSKAERDLTLPSSLQNSAGGDSTNIIEHTASIITKMDNHINTMRARATEKNGFRESNQAHSRYLPASDFNSPSAAGSSTRSKRRTKTYLQVRRSLVDTVDKNNETDDNSISPHNIKNNSELFRNLHEENVNIEMSFSGWEERVRPAELERAVLSLLEFGQITAARQLQQKLSPANVPSELVIVDAALKLAAVLSPSSSGEMPTSIMDSEVCSVMQLYDIPTNDSANPLQVLESLAMKCTEGCGRGLCKRIIAVVKAANVLGLSFSEAFEKRPIELLQLLSLKAQDSLEEARFLVQTHVMPPATTARILAESFLKGLLAAHRGGYMDSQKDEGPAPLLWRFSDFLKWAELCPSEPEIGHALMRLVITGQEIPHACEVELLILSHHFYKSSSCLDGVDVLVALAANRVESYVIEGDFSCLARLVTGVSNFHALNFILGILIENGQLELLLQKYSAADTAAGTAESVRGFRMAVLTSLKHFNPHDLDAFAMVYNHFDMKHETASLLESRSTLSMHQWFLRHDKDRQNEDLLESMRYLIEAAEVYSTIDAGQKTHHACACASLLSLQIRIPDLHWLDLSATNARRTLVEQSRFQEALIVAEAYGLNQAGEWALVLWNQMLRPDLIEQFVAEFVVVLPLQASTLLDLARFYRAEVAARGDQSHFSVWLSPGGLPAEWVKHLGRSFRCLLRTTRDLRLRVQLATIATGFNDVTDACAKMLDKVPDTAGLLILRRGHGGAYLPLM